jgi:hypothetical protein
MDDQSPYTAEEDARWEAVCAEHRAARDAETQRIRELERKAPARRGQTFKSQYGRKSITVSAQCPTYAIRNHLARTHVGTPPSEVEAEIREAARGDAWTPKLVAEAVRFALWQHAENLAAYYFVMGYGLKAR